MDQRIIDLVCDTLVRAGSTFRPDQKEAYRRAMKTEKNELANWCLATTLENAEVAEKNRSPLCDDTGIPHLFVEIGPNRQLTGDMMAAIQEGVRKGLRTLPGRPMAIMGNDIQRLDQSGGLDPDSAALAAAPMIIKNVDEDVLRVTVLMTGGGPAIRGITERVFHKHNAKVVADEIVARAKDRVSLLGCSPCTLAVGIGRSQYEATALMIEAMAKGNYDKQTEMEKYITDEVNKVCTCGPLGLGGDTAVLATFMKVGPQRASGVRIVALRPCCCFEPRCASVEL